MYRTAVQVRRVRQYHGLTQKGLAEACGVTETTAGRWDRYGIPENANQANMDSFRKLEDQIPSDNQATLEMRAQIAGSLVDLNGDDLSELLKDVKTRQLHNLLLRYGNTGECRGAQAVADDAQSAADNGKPNRQA